MAVHPCTHASARPRMKFWDRNCLVSGLLHQYTDFSVASQAVHAVAEIRIFRGGPTGVR
jgi:hypothetical protein